jgi:hypothetical protein
MGYTGRGHPPTLRGSVRRRASRTSEEARAYVGECGGQGAVVGYVARAPRMARRKRVFSCYMLITGFDTVPGSGEKVGLGSCLLRSWGLGHS